MVRRIVGIVGSALVLAAAGCSWDVGNIPCQSDSNCPNGMGCDPGAGHCIDGPGAPQNFKLSVAPYSVSLQWDLNPDAQQYIVYRGPAGGALAPIQTVAGQQLHRLHRRQRHSGPGLRLRSHSANQQQ